jgi:hypothetical protein
LVRLPVPLQCEGSICTMLLQRLISLCKDRYRDLPRHTAICSPEMRQPVHQVSCMRPGLFVTVSSH